MTVKVCDKVADRIVKESGLSDLIICEGDLVAVVETVRSGTTDRITVLGNMVVVVKITRIGTPVMIANVCGKECKRVNKNIMTAQYGGSICTNMTATYGHIMDRDMIACMCENTDGRKVTQVKELSDVAEMNLKWKGLEQGRMLELECRYNKNSVHES